MSEATYGHRFAHQGYLLVLSLLTY